MVDINQLVEIRVVFGTTTKGASDVTRSFIESLDRFDELASDVEYATHDVFADRLLRWFEFIDSTPEMSLTTAKFESNFDYEEWQKTGLVSRSGIGSGKIVLPRDETDRIGAQLKLFRTLTVSDDAPWRFAGDYVSHEANFDDIVRDLVDKYFTPFARDLRREIDRNQGILADKAHPDRIVVLGNEGIQEQAILALEEVIAALKVTNVHIEPGEKAQQIAQLNAGKELLKSKQVRVGSMLETAGNTLKYIGKKFYDSALSLAAKQALQFIFKIFGMDG
ncbi:MAG: hypothetical protein P8P99_07265 [Maricaulis sp.]|nr:hypothetical protein [Maricaulis sp.]